MATFFPSGVVDRGLVRQAAALMDIGALKQSQLSDIYSQFEYIQRHHVEELVRFVEQGIVCGVVHNTVISGPDIETILQLAENRWPERMVLIFDPNLLMPST